MKKYTKQEWAYTTIGLALGVAVALSLGQGNYMMGALSAFFGICGYILARKSATSSSFLLRGRKPPPLRAQLLPL